MAPILAGKRVANAGKMGGSGEIEVFGEETEIGGVAGSPADGDDDGESRGEDEDGEGKQTNQNVPQEAVFHCGWLHVSLPRNQREERRKCRSRV